MAAATPTGEKELLYATTEEKYIVAYIITKRIITAQMKPRESHLESHLGITKHSDYEDGRS